MNIQGLFPPTHTREAGGGGKGKEYEMNDFTYPTLALLEDDAGSVCCAWR